MKVIIKGRKIYVGFFKIFLYYDNFCRLVVFHIFIRSWRKPVTHISRERLSFIGWHHCQSSWIKCRKQVTSAGTGCY